MIKIKPIILAAFLSLSALTFSAFADEGADNPKPSSGVPHESAASFDKRLPPVLPGEEITKDGKTVKVWSSSGPVVVADEPDPSHTPGQQLPAGIGVVVDQRHDQKGHHPGRVP